MNMADLEEAKFKFEKKLGGRKFILVCLIFIVTSILTYFRIVGEDVYQAVVFLLVSAYIAGNVAHKYVEVSNTK